MIHPRAYDQPNFFWQGLFILLPVVALALAGFFSVRQDKLLAEAGARTQANALADALVADLAAVFDPAGFATHAPALAESVASFWDHPLDPAQESLFHLARSQKLNSPTAPLVTESQGRMRVFRTASDPPQQLVLLDQQGDLIYPPPLRDAPLPRPSSPVAFTLEQSNLWSEVRAAEFIQRDFSKAADACDRLLNSAPPGELVAGVTYEAGMALAQAGQWRKAQDRFARVARESHGDLSESGLPLRQLALWQIAKILSTPAQATEAPPANRPAKTSAEAGTDGFPPNPADQIRNLWNQLCAECILHPTLLSEQILNLALPQADQGWRGVWEFHETSRSIFELWRNSPAAIEKRALSRIVLLAGGPMVGLARQKWGNQ